MWLGQGSSESTQMPFILSQKKYFLEAERHGLLSSMTSIKAKP